MADKKILIVFYSESGHIRKISDELAAELGATVEGIRACSLPEGAWGFAVRIWQSLSGASADIVEPSQDPAKFDLVLVGSPVWAGRLASPVRAWLRQFGSRIKTGAAFVSCSRSGAESALAEVDRWLTGRVLAHLSVCDKDRVHGLDIGKIQDFVSAIERSAVVPPAVC